MSIDFSSCTEEELWKYVGSHLAKNGFDAVLVGGAVVSIYSKGAYRSGDLDFVIQNMFKTDLVEVMKDIGFIKHGRHYIHPECKHLFVEYPPGPLGVGEDTSITPDIHSAYGVEIKILSPTDCIKDRLASYIHFKSQEGLDEAILVAKSQQYSVSKVEEWCKKENAEWAFKDFTKKLM
jgi:hypothetical protein